MSSTQFHGDPGFYVRYFDMHVNSWIESDTTYGSESMAISVARRHAVNPEVREVEVWERILSVSQERDD